MNRKCYAVFTLFIVLYITSCAVPIVDHSRLQYIAPDLDNNSLVEGGMSLLPVVAGDGQEGLRRPLANKLNKHLDNILPEGKFIGALQTMDLINNAGLTEYYSKMIEDYDRAAILNKDSLIKIGGAVGVEYLLYVKLLEQSRVERKSPLLRDKRGVPVVLMETFRMRIFGQLWSSKSSDVVWEGTGEIFVQGDQFRTIKATIDQLVDISALSFLNNLPGFNIPMPKLPKHPKPKNAGNTFTPML